MKWIKERDALIAQTMAFVQSVTGKKDDFHPPDAATTPFVAVGAETTVTVQEVVTVQEIVTVQSAAVEAASPPAAAPPKINPPPPPAMMTPPRASTDFRSEMQARIANFRKHQERFEREREEYCASTLVRLRAAIRDPSIRPPAEE